MRRQLAAAIDDASGLLKTDGRQAQFSAADFRYALRAIVGAAEDAEPVAWIVVCRGAPSALCGSLRAAEAIKAGRPGSRIAHLIEWEEE